MKNVRSARWAVGVCLTLSLFVLFAWFAAIFAPAPVRAAEKPGKSRHVLLLCLDGVMPAALQKAKAPNLKALAAGGTVTWDAYSGGELGKPSQSNTASLSCWASALTGVWANKHQMWTWKKCNMDYKNYPLLFERVKARDPKARCVSIATWPRFNSFIVKKHGVDVEMTCAGDVASAAAMVKELAEANPTVACIQLDHVDGEGGTSGFSPENPKYIASIETLDLRVGELLAAVKARRNHANEEWLIVASTDHGGLGTNHGGQSPEERTIFLMVSGPGVAAGKVVSSGPGLTAVAPTVLKFLGVEIKKDWKLDAEPFGLGK